MYKSEYKYKSENVQIYGPKCQYILWPPLFSSSALTLLDIEFNRASQVAPGVLFHSLMMTSRSWWMLKTLHSSNFHLRTPHSLPLPSASLTRQWSSWRCVWGRYHVRILPCGPVSKGPSWFPQGTVAPQCRQHSCIPRP